ncbi:hypothetical protein [Heyndrickxia sporothermodurans]|uniref:Uncharacterized protein n=1 Tax=Heyndrickxia sporothermodurans TaxID=46224 RepID=A0AB37HGQ0_9BACI|nr:hypothetical protein [Heyndrickxia sporothermodurans]MBL5768404.1 hypothetical protein [Heyndrickxia sporothermodurans]MBL5771031.1 hypothetical protein [Heyndrickxia sporothermodurans]MBL5774673.1 hypothetical protein [Heyndrickxia sporothermodurans]MBL5778133.1 hypothetical protein [Heyndrickxia sporothermodurans]MBL5785406.1 hypothetical protein [Heyndrickxia sporothermodurans]
MKNEKMLTVAIEMLRELNPEEFETVQIDNTKYDDGSIGFTVCVTFPATKD